MIGICNTGGGSSSGGAYVIIVNCSEDLIGENITATKGLLQETAQVKNDGTATFKLNEGGIWTFSEPIKSHYKTLNLTYYGQFEITLKTYTLYGFTIMGTESTPANMISYEVSYNGQHVENYNYNSAYMDYTNGTFNSGDWNLEDDFFIPKPCMLKYNGEVDYYLKPNNYTKKIDDSASDITNTAYNGNAMMEWGRDGKKIWYKIVPNITATDGATFYIADDQLDNDFHCWSFYNCDNELIEHFYTPIYNGVNVSNKIRSISGQSIMNNVTGANEVTYALANNVNNKNEWDTEVLADRILINILLLMIGKSTDTQTIFGNGHYTGGSAAGNLLQTGTMNTNGLFWGTNDTGHGVKVFGMENYWGNQWRRIRGYLNMNGTQKIKLTYGTVDGSTQTGYDNTGSGYITVPNCTPSGTSGGYISQMVYTDKGMFAKTASGSQTTYYTDGLWFSNSQANYALVGGACSNGFIVGALCVDLNNAFSSARWSVGASISCKPISSN